MNWLMIENKGVITTDALMLMGGTTKRDNPNTIGFFGSGNKYSIATLLKKGIEFKIFAGNEEIQIECKEHNFRDVKLQKIFINGQDTCLTTTMGPDWKTWFCIREWYSNALDEGGCNVVLGTETLAKKEGYTRFYVQITPDMQDVIDNWDNYFTMDRLDCIEEVNGNKVFPQTDSKETYTIFRKGIRAEYAEGTKSLYQWDLKNVDINESRVISNSYSAKIEIAKFINTLEDTRVIKNILKNAYQGGYVEDTLNWDAWSISKLSKTFRKAIDNHRIIVGSIAGYFTQEQEAYDCYIVSETLAKKIKNNFPDVIVYGILDDGTNAEPKTPVTPTKKMEFLLKECNRFFDEAGYEIKYPIEVVDFQKDEILGLAENGTIFISYKQFEKGKKDIVATLVEENEHLKTGYKDMSRAFQSHFINLFLSQMEERISFFL